MNPLVAILMGSRSDLPVMGKAAAVLGEFDVPAEVRVLSAHRAPEALSAFVTAAESRGVQIFIAAAGMAAHLAGAVAARTTLPVVGVPLSATLGGLDALLSTVQMPPGVPVATVGVDAAKNAAYLAVSILALTRPDLAQRLRSFRRNMADEAAATSLVGEGEWPGAGPAGIRQRPAGVGGGAR
jgi:5-(carboxyamino)imidazole ribonucleotide mutase